MSGVYIKGFEMPTNCFDCKMRTAVGCCGNLPHNTRMPNCPIFPVSEGRMNDAMVHGHWIERTDYVGDAYYDCSACGESWTTIEGDPWDNGMDYCPKCGAKMDEVTES